MRLVDIVSTHASDGRSVLATEEAMPLVERIDGVAAVTADLPDRAVVIHRAVAGDEMPGLGRIAGLVGERGVGLLVLDAPMTALPLGDLLRSLGQERLRALAVHSLASSGTNTAVVVTRDADEPLRSHVLGEWFPTTGPEAGLRRDNELVVESVVARALRGELERRLHAAGEVEQELRAEIEHLRGECEAQTRSAADAQAEVARLERALALVERRSPGYRFARLASKIRTDAVGAGRDLVGRRGGRQP